MTDCLKRVLSLCMALVLVAGIVSGIGLSASAADYISTPEELDGAAYTTSDLMAAKLNEIFAGDIDIYTDKGYTKEASLPVGSRVNASIQYYITNSKKNTHLSGWQCYIYANAVYNKLFGEWVGHADEKKNYQVVLSGGSGSVSYEMFRDAGVRCGAYLRTTGNADGSYSGSVGHSMIILAYGKENLTYLEGNADGNGLVRVTIRSWSDFNARLLGGRGRYLNHVVQPTESYYNSLYPSCTHTGYDALGVCATCGYTFGWMATGDPWAMGYYQLNAKTTPVTGSPYTAAPKADFTLDAGLKIKLTEKYTNAFGESWYAYENEKGQIFYIPGEGVSFVEYVPFEAVCSDFSPPDQSVLEPQSYPVKGIVTSNYPMKELYAYLDGVEYARWTATDQLTTRVDLRATDVNYDLTFSKLEDGAHTITIKAISFVHSTPVLVHESVFYMTRPCTHSYNSQVTTQPTCTTEGVRTHTCIYCGESYTTAVAVLAHDYEKGVCTLCGDRISVTLTGTVTAAGVSGDPVTVTLLRDGKVYTATTNTDQYSITVPAGNYLMGYSKAGCVTGSVSLELTEGNVTWNLKLCPKGDVTGDYSVNVGDVAKGYAHIRGVKKLIDAYAIRCADFTEDGTVNVGDIAKLYAKVRGKL